MKTHLLSAVTIAASFLGATLCAEEPEAIRLMPEIQALLGQVLKAGDGASGQSASRDGNEQAGKPSTESEARIAEILKGTTASGNTTDGQQLAPAIQALLAELLKSTLSGQSGANAQSGNSQVDKALAAAMQALAAQLAEVKTANPSPDAANPQDAQTAKTLVEVQTLLGQLLKSDASTAEAPQATTPATPSANTAQTQRKKAPQNGLQTHSLTTGTLQPSTSLDGTPRLTGEEWRQLFPGK